MTVPGVDDLLGDLSAELRSVEPSAEFHARVRLAATAAPAWRTWVRWGLAGAAPAAIATWFLVVGVTPGRVDPPAPAPTPAVALPAPWVAMTPGAGTETRPGAVVSRPPVARRAATPRTGSTAAGPRLDVITDQPELLAALWSRFSSGSRPSEADGAAPISLPAAFAPEPLTVPPIVVADAVPAGPRPASGSPTIRRLVGEAARRDAR